MKRIKVKFSGMGGRFDEDNNFIINTLKKKYDVVISDRPDYLIYSVNSRDYLNYDCVRIFYTAENVIPDFNICDYAIGFHHIQFEDRYFRFPLYLVDGFNAYEGDDYAADLSRALHKHDIAEELLKEKKAFCSFVYSNSDAAPCRQRIYDALNEYKTIDSGGRYLNNIGGPVHDKYQFQLKHKFAIAFENTCSPGYTTEKIVHAFSAGTIPIYWGDPLICETFNPDSFVDCNAYGLTSDGTKEAMDRIIKKIIEIDTDEDLYLQMLKTPAFNEGYSVNEQKNNFEHFILHIFDQELKDAGRRNKLLWGERYERKQKIGNTVYWILRKGIPIRDSIKNVVKWRKR